MQPQKAAGLRMFYAVLHGLYCIRTTQEFRSIQIQPDSQRLLRPQRDVHRCDNIHHDVRHGRRPLYRPQCDSCASKYCATHLANSKPQLRAYLHGHLGDSGQSEQSGNLPRHEPRSMFDNVLQINAIVWRNDAINRAPAWCDFSTKVGMPRSLSERSLMAALQIGIASPIGIVAGNVCVTRFLSQIVAPRAKMMTSRDQRHRAFFDVALCFGLPIFVMATNILYQPIRFGISRTLGCQFAFAISWPTFVLWLLWAPLLALTAAAYGGLSFPAARLQFLIAQQAMSSIAY